MPNETPTLTSVFTDIADAIRAKNGSQETYAPTEMPAAIAAIEGGGSNETMSMRMYHVGSCPPYLFKAYYTTEYSDSYVWIYPFAGKGYIYQNAVIDITSGRQGHYQLSAGRSKESLPDVYVFDNVTFVCDYAWDDRGGYLLLEEDSAPDYFSTFDQWRASGSSPKKQCLYTYVFKDTNVPTLYPGHFARGIYGLWLDGSSTFGGSTYGTKQDPISAPSTINTLVYGLEATISAPVSVQGQLAIYCCAQNLKEYSWDHGAQWIADQCDHANQSLANISGVMYMPYLTGVYTWDHDALEEETTHFDLDNITIKLTNHGLLDFFSGLLVQQSGDTVGWPEDYCMGSFLAPFNFGSNVHFDTSMVDDLAVPNPYSGFPDTVCGRGFICINRTRSAVLSELQDIMLTAEDFSEYEGMNGQDKYEAFLSVKLFECTDGSIYVSDLWPDAESLSWNTGEGGY